MKKILIVLCGILLLTGCSNKKEPVVEATKEDNETPLTESIKDFNLDNSYLSAQIEKTENKGDKYIENTIFIGDSVPLYYEMTGFVVGKQVWHKEGMSLKEIFTQELYVNSLESGKTAVGLVEEYKPKRIIISLGMNSVATMSKNYFIDQYTKLIQEMKKVSPDTTIIVNAIPPVAASYDDGDYELNNENINKFNYYLLKMCSEQNVKFLNTAKVLKDENGQCKVGYFIDSDGAERAHQTEEGNKIVFDYIKTHAVN